MRTASITHPSNDVYAAGLERYPVRYESRMVGTPLGQTHVLLSGEAGAPPLVLIHGAGMNALAWLGQVAQFSRSYRVIAVDLPGQTGRSDVRRLPLTGAGTANWLAGLLDGLKLSRAHLLGGSLGGWVALRFAAAFPTQVDKLVLVAPGGIVGVNWPAFVQYAPALLSRSPAKTGAFIQKMARKPIAPDVLSFLSRMIVSQPRRTAVVPTVLSSAELARVAAPTLIVLGDSDQVFPLRRMLPRAQAALPGAQIVPLSACGHLIPHDQPDAMMRAVMAFLES